MEPSGMMDNKSPGLQPSGRCPPAPAVAANEHNLADFTVCDLGDEEVHFSRNASDYYYQVDSNNNNNNNSNHYNGDQPDLAARQCHSWSGHSSIQPLDSSNLHYNNFHAATTIASSDQARSSKLLSAIGNKLRRGSNYLNAPTKLVGHYLLGITIQSWAEFFNTARMTRAPKTRHQLARRLATNLSHFQGNYLCVSLVLVVYCILTSPLLLLAIAAYLLTLYLVTVRSALGKQARVLGFRLNLQQQYSFITMLAVPPLWIAGAPSAVFWVIGASFFVVGLHASMFINDQVLSEQQLAEAAVAAGRALPCNAGAAIGVARRLSQEPATSYNNNNNNKKSPAHYYNHYPELPGDRHGGYISLARAAQSGRQAPTATTTGGGGGGGSSRSTTGGSGNYVASTISQWISFGGGGGGAAAGYLPARNNDASGAQAAEAAGGQQPDVKIISRDYAGLGRVYEV